MVTGSDFTVTENPTSDRKRVNLTIHNEEEVITVIESQDATGWLDSIHGKIFYYMFEMKCFDGVLLTEDADELIKQFVQLMNLETPFNVWLIAVRIYKETSKTPYVDFVPIMRPTSIHNKRIVRKNKGESSGKTEYKWVDFLASKFEQHQDIFSNVTSYYIDTKNVAGSKINIGIEPRTDFFNVTMHHAGRYDTEVFRQEVENIANNWDMKVSPPYFNSLSARFRASSWDEALSCAVHLIDTLNARRIKLIPKK